MVLQGGVGFSSGHFSQSYGQFKSNFQWLFEIGNWLLDAVVNVFLNEEKKDGASWQNSGTLGCLCVWVWPGGCCIIPFLVSEESRPWPREWVAFFFFRLGWAEVVLVAGAVFICVLLCSSIMIQIKRLNSIRPKYPKLINEVSVMYSWHLCSDEWCFLQARGVDIVFVRSWLFDPDSGSQPQFR